MSLLGNVDKCNNIEFGTTLGDELVDVHQQGELVFYTPEGRPENAITYCFSFEELSKIMIGDKPKNPWTRQDFNKDFIEYFERNIEPTKKYKEAVGRLMEEEEKAEEMVGIDTTILLKVKDVYPYLNIEFVKLAATDPQLLEQMIQIYLDREGSQRTLRVLRRGFSRLMRDENYKEAYLQMMRGVDTLPPTKIYEWALYTQTYLDQQPRFSAEVIDLSNKIMPNTDFRGRDLSGANLTNADFSFSNFEGVNLKEADLSGANLTGANLTHANLTDAILYEANLSGANLSGADLREADLREADLTGANLTGADLSEADLDDAVLNRAILNNAILPDANLNKVDLRYAKLLNANLKEAKLSDAWLNGADLRKADLGEAFLWEANLTGADLSGANLTGADLSEADLSGANLTEADLSGANLRGVKLEGTILKGIKNLSEAKLMGLDLTGVGVNLSETNLTDAWLMEANLSGVNLKGANLTDAWLMEANLTGADLTGANLTGANLYDANLTRANLTGANLKGAGLGRANLENAILDGAILTEIYIWDDKEKKKFPAFIENGKVYKHEKRRILRRTRLHNLNPSQI